MSSAKIIPLFIELQHKSCICTQALFTHPPYQVLAAVDDVARQAGIVNARDRYTLRLVMSLHRIHKDRQTCLAAKNDVNYLTVMLTADKITNLLD